MFDLAIPLSILIAIGAILLPWLGSLMGRRAAAKLSLVLSATATVLFVLGEAFYKAGGEVRIDLVIMPPMLLVAWLVYGRCRSAARSEEEGGDTPGNRLLSRFTSFVLWTLLALFLLWIFTV